MMINRFVSAQPKTYRLIGYLNETKYITPEGEITHKMHFKIGSWEKPISIDQAWKSYNLNKKHLQNNSKLTTA